MSVQFDSEELRHTYEHWSSDEIQDRIDSGGLAPEAERIARDVLAARTRDEPLGNVSEQENDSPVSPWRRMVGLSIVITLIPILGYTFAGAAQLRYEGEWLALVDRELGSKGVAAVKSGDLTFERFCSRPPGFDEPSCGRYRSTLLLRYASVTIAGIGFALLAAIIISAKLATANRRLLLALFAPGTKIVLVVLFLLIIVQGGIATYAAYILEVTYTQRVHYIIFTIALGAIYGAGVMMSAGSSMTRPAKAFVIGKALSREEQPRLWAFIQNLAEQLSAQPPKHLVVGLQPTFYVTAAEVVVLPGPATYSDETLYLSLPLMRILSTEELAAVIGHELGHFRGEDTKFSLSFYPIYAGTTQALGALRAQRKGLYMLASIPAIALLRFFLEKFATAERSIGRERELEADKAGASVASPRAIATSLLKIGAFSSIWEDIRSAMIDALGRGNAYANVSALFGEIAAKSWTPDRVAQVAEHTAAHPTDAHPPTSQRIAALGIEMSGLRNEPFQIEAAGCAALILDGVTELEEQLTEIAHRVLLETGEARLPETAPGRSPQG